MNSFKSKNVSQVHQLILNRHVLSFCLITLAVLFLSKDILAQQLAGTLISLPKPDVSHGMPLNLTLKSRRSLRRFSKKSISLSELSQLLWSAQGVTHLLGFRTAPSAGALYPLEVFLVAKNVDELPQGIYHYKPNQHALELHIAGDHHKQLYEAANRQSSIKNSAVTFIITAVTERTGQRYGQRAKQYVSIEAGSAAQNVYLEATSLKLGTVFVGTFKDKELLQLLKLPSEYMALGIMPIGHRP